MDIKRQIKTDREVISVRGIEAATVISIGAAMSAQIISLGVGWMIMSRNIEALMSFLLTGTAFAILVLVYGKLRFAEFFKKSSTILLASTVLGVFIVLDVLMLILLPDGSGTWLIVACIQTLAVPYTVLMATDDIKDRLRAKPKEGTQQEE